MEPTVGINLRLSAEKLKKAAHVLKAVSHPVRISIIDLLDQCERLHVGAIQEKLGMEQAVVSHHLSIMRDKGVLQTGRDGKHIYYSLTDTTITNIIHCINSCDSF